MILDENIAEAGTADEYRVRLPAVLTSCELQQVFPDILKDSLGEANRRRIR